MKGLETTAEQTQLQHQRLEYADLLKTLAMLLVIMLHVSTNWMDRYPLGDMNWNIACVCNSFTRYGVPLFAAISGMFLLDPQKNITYRNLFCKYIPRAFAALLFWGIFYAMLLECFHNGFSWGGLLRSAEFVLRGNKYYHLWYLYMLLGLYLMTPFLRCCPSL